MEEAERSDNPEAPAHLSPEARVEWRRVTSNPSVMAELGLRSSADAAIYCQAWARMATAERHVNEHGVIVPAPRTGSPIVNPNLTIAERAAAVIQKAARKPTSGTRHGNGSQGPGHGGPARGGPSRPSEPFTADSPTRETVAQLDNGDVDEQAFRAERRAERRDRKRLKEERTIELEDRLYKVGMGKEPEATLVQITAARAVHAIWNGLPVATNVNLTADDVASLSDDELRAELAASEREAASVASGDGAEKLSE